MNVIIINQSKLSQISKDICADTKTQATAISLIGNNELGFYGEISHPENPGANKFRIVQKNDGYHMAGTMILEGMAEKDFFIEAVNGPNERNIRKMMKHPEFMEYVIASYDPLFSGVVEFKPYLLYNPGASLVYQLMAHVFCSCLDITSMSDLYDTIKLNATTVQYLKKGEKKLCPSQDSKFPLI